MRLRGPSQAISKGSLYRLVQVLVWAARERTVGAKALGDLFPTDRFVAEPIFVFLPVGHDGAL